MTGADDRDRVRLWGKLTDNQRLYLINSAVPPRLQVRQSHFIAAMNSLIRLDLLQQRWGSWGLTEDARELVAWACEHGYARHEGERWEFSVPRPWRSVDPEHLAQLAAAGHYGSEIAAKLGVSREAIRQAAKRLDITLPRKAKKSDKVIRLHVSLEESAEIQRAADDAGLSVSNYLRRVIMGEDEESVS